MPKPTPDTAAQASPMQGIAGGELGDWRLAYPWGETLHPDASDGKFVVDAGFADDMIAAFRHFRDEYGYFPPLLPMHGKDDEGDGKDGESGPRMRDVYPMAWGVVADMRTTDRGVEYRPFYAAGVRQLDEQGKLPYVSPTHAEEFVDPHTGRLFRNMLTELSYVRKPNIKAQGLQVPFYTDLSQGLVPLTNDEKELVMSKSKQTPPENAETPDVDEEAVEAENADDEEMENAEDLASQIAQMAGQMQEMIKAIQGLAGKLDQMMGAGEAESGEPENAEDGDGAEDDATGETPAPTTINNGVQNAEVQSLKSQVAQLRKRAAKAELASKFGDVDDDVAAVVAGLDESQQAQLMNFCEGLAAREVENAGPRELGEVGTQGRSAGAGKLGWDEALAKLDAEGVPHERRYSTAVSRWPHLQSVD